MVKIDFIVGKFLHEDIIHSVILDDTKHDDAKQSSKTKAPYKNYKHINRRHAEDNKQDK